MNKILNFKLNKYEKYALAIFIIVFLFIRFLNLTILPIFTDEAIYIRWSEIAWSVRSLRDARVNIFIPLSDGKQPLFMWLAGVPMQFMSDHLAAGRLPSIFSGLIAAIGFWLAAYELFKNKKIAWTAAVLYLVLPFTLLYDRMALADSMLAMFGIWTIYLTFVLLRTLNVKVALSLGIVYGLGLLTKSPALFFWALTPTSLLFIKNFIPASKKSVSINFSDYAFWNWTKTEWNFLFRWSWLWGIAVIIGQVFQYSLRVSNMYHMIGRKNLEFVLTFQEFEKAPFGLLLGNMTGMSTWFYGYLGPLLVICAFIALLWGIYKLDKRIAYLFILAIVPWVASASFAKVLYPRYLLFFTPPILLIISYGMYLISQGANKILSLKTEMQKLAVTAVTYLLLLSYSFYFSYLLLFNPPAAPLPLQDKEQYVVDWPSGYGVNEMYDFLKSELDKNGKLAIGTEGTFGLMPFSLQIKFYDEIYRREGKPSRLFIDGYWPFNNIPQPLMEYAPQRPTYFLVYQQEKPLSKDCPVELVKTYVKPGGQHTIRLYKVRSLGEYKPIPCFDQ